MAGFFISGFDMTKHAVLFENADIVGSGDGWVAYLVSIHAPVWGATWLVRWYNRTNIVSIHAPVWGATAYLVTDSYYN